MVARIFQPTKNAMQSGRGKAKFWLLEHERETRRTIEPLMGYTSSSDMKQQIRLTFESMEEAVAYAKRNDIAYRVSVPKERKVRPVSYSDNFKYNRLQSWTH